MAGTKFLDLDIVRKPVGEFKLEGKRYKVWPLRIRQIINVQTPADGVPNQQQDLVALIDMLAETVPDCPRDKLEALDVTQLNALTAWVQNAGSEDAEKNSPAPSSNGAVTTAAPALTSP